MIFLGADHNGMGLKEALKPLLKDYVDFGPYDYDTTVDYNVIATQVAQAVYRSHPGGARAILICGTGIGMSMAANKVSGIRAALVHNQLAALKSREHNDANILCLGAWVNGKEENLIITQEWLGAPFGEGRHVRRLAPMEPRVKLVFVNGVFDILHKGHVEMLRWAKLLGDRLVVGMNSDSSVKEIKGSGRPVNNQTDRKAVLQALGMVDEVIVFDDLSPFLLINRLLPDIVVRGGEFTADEIRVRDGIPDGVVIRIFPRVPDYSTTDVIRKARA